MYNLPGIKKLAILVLFLFGMILIALGARSAEVPVQPKVVATPTTQVSGQEALVTRVIDGDTIEIEGGVKVRYIGIDTPETVDPRRPVGCFGKEASEANKKLVEGKEVILEKDISDTDKYGRLLRLVYLKEQNGNLLFVNDYLVREGFAKASTYPPDVKFADQFVQAEREAREAKRGLWQKCF